MVTELPPTRKPDLLVGFIDNTLNNCPVNLFSYCVSPGFHCLLHKCCESEKWSLIKIQVCLCFKKMDMLSTIAPDRMAGLFRITTKELYRIARLTSAPGKDDQQVISKGNVKVGNKYKDNYVQLAKPHDAHCLLFQPWVICAISFSFCSCCFIWIKIAGFRSQRPFVITNVGTN